MFDKIDDVPAPIKEFYKVETREDQQFNEDGSPKLQEVEYQYEDEEGNTQTGSRLEPVFLPVDHVVPVSMDERKTIEDVWRVVHLHHGKRDDLIRRFLTMVCCNNKWQFHDEYMTWYVIGQELDAVVLPEPEEGDPDPLLELQARIEAHKAKEPVNPCKIDIQQWFYDNYSDLREAAYPPKDKQFEMQFDDLKNGTNHWFETIEAVKKQYPKPPAQPELTPSK